MIPPRSTVAAFILGLALSGAFTSAAAQRSPGPPPDPVARYESYERAMTLYSEGRYGEAIPLLAELTDRYGLDSALWFRLARARELTDDPVGAIEAYRRTMELGYRHTWWTAYRMARLFAGLAEADSAMAWLERALDERYDDRPGIAEDPAFESLRDDPRFGRITGRVTGRELGRDEGWRRDLEFLISEARRMHADPGRPAFSSAFDSMATALHEQIPRLSDDAILQGLKRLLVLLGDGHTSVFGPEPESMLVFESRVLPLRFYHFDDGLYVIDGVDAARCWIGSRVTAFGPVAVEDALHQLAPLTPADNRMTVRWLGVRHVLPRLRFLHAIGATDDPDRATLTLRDPTGRTHRVTLEGGDHEFGTKLMPPPGADTPAPLYLREVDRNYWLEALSGHDAVYVQFNQVRNLEDGPSIATFADTVRSTLEGTGARNAIIDVRHNNGGDNGLLGPLVRTLVWWQEEDADHRIFVLTGRNTFSAAQSFITHLDRWTDAVFVGEPSSSRPNHAGESTNVVLPYSRVRASVSTLYWQDSDPDDRRPWIAPRVPVALTSEDYFANRDPALEAVLAIIGAPHVPASPPGR